MDNLPPNIPEEALPTPDFMEMVNRIEKTTPQVTESPTTNDNDVIMVETPTGPVPLKKASAVINQDPNSPDVPSPQKQPEEIKLEYKFQGDCPKHINPVSTLTAEVDGKCIVFAYCEQCKKNIYSQTVPIIGEEIITIPRKFKRAGKELNGRSS